MKTTYCSGELVLVGPVTTAIVTVQERFVLTRLAFLFQGREHPRWFAWIHAFLGFLGPAYWDGRIAHFLHGLIDRWILRENRRVLGGVGVREIKIGNVDQLAPGLRVPALLLDGKPIPNLDGAMPGTKISVALEGTCPVPIVVLFSGQPIEERMH